ncbi:MAG: Spo0B domain-containing protein [Peptococcaceae bacterium]|nr:Spo0B domain-containing protein [Peptococcaceae bacterium]
MRPTTFLEIMSMQRHDFLNHLQVIYGLVQLNKNDQVKEYIKQVSREVEMLSKVGRLAVPEVATALLVGYFSALKNQVGVLYDINTGLGQCSIPGNILAEVLEEVFNHALKCLLPPGESDRQLRVSVTEMENKYMFKVSSSGHSSGSAETVRAGLAGVKERIVSHGGKIGIAVSGREIEIYVLFS